METILLRLEKGTWQDTSCGFSCGRYNDCSRNALFSVGCGNKLTPDSTVWGAHPNERKDALCVLNDSKLYYSSSRRFSSWSKWMMLVVTLMDHTQFREAS